MLSVAASDGGSDTGDDIWETYLLHMTQRLLTRLSPPLCLSAYYEYLDFRMEALREVLMDLHCHMSDRYESYCPMLESACDVLTSLRLQRIGGDSDRMSRINTALRVRSPSSDAFFGALNLQTIRCSLDPEKYMQQVADELDFFVSLDARVPVPVNVSWTGLSLLWKELMCISTHVNLHALD